MARTDLIGDDFRLDLGNPSEDGERSGTAKLGDLTAEVTVFGAHEGEDILILVDGVDCWASFMVDVAPVVKREMEHRATCASL